MAIGQDKGAMLSVCGANTGNTGMDMGHAYDSYGGSDYDYSYNK